MEHPMLPLLERAELAAREHLLAARAEAERRRASARAEADRIAAAADAQATAAAAEVQRGVLQRSSLEIAAVERALAELEGQTARRGPGGATRQGATRQMESAVERIVAAVLGEQEGQ